VMAGSVCTSGYSRVHRVSWRSNRARAVGFRGRLRGHSVLAIRCGNL
jgi:hypothetical protein